LYLIPLDGYSRFITKIGLVSAMSQRPNHALQRTRPSRPGCNPGVAWAGSLSLGRYVANTFAVT
jgi:hypothetical protein